MYSQALDAEILPNLFWSLSIGEIIDMIESYTKRKRQEYKMQISFDFVQAELIGIYLSKQFDTKNKIKMPNPWDYFPGIFSEEAAAAKEQGKAKELALYKAQMHDFTLRFNSKQKGGEG